MAGSLKSHIGDKSRLYEETVELKQIANFVKAVGATGEDTPPTFLTVFRKGEFELLDSIGVALSRVLHAEQEYVYESPILAGDRLSYQTVLANVLEKQGSDKRPTMRFLAFETRVVAYRAESSVPIGTGRTTIVVRGD